MVPRVKKKSAGCRACSYRAPFLWNNLPPDIRQSGSIDAFKSKLKTHLFDLAFNYSLMSIASLFSGLVSVSMSYL